MAKQNRPIIWEVTIGFISFYKRCGVGCVRMKSNLTAERWRKDPAFKGSRRSAACMALASPLASAVYQTIPEQQRVYPHYKQLVAIAQHMLCQGYNIKQVNKVLRFAVARYLRKIQATDPNRKPERSPFAATLSLKTIPAFTPMMPQQLAVPGFSNITISSSLFRPWPLVLTSRGSPTAIVGYTHNIQEHQHADLPSTIYTPVITSHPQWQGLLHPIPAKSAISSPKQHSNTSKTFL